MEGRGIMKKFFQLKRINWGHFRIFFRVDSGLNSKGDRAWARAAFRAAMSSNPLGLVVGAGAMVAHAVEWSTKKTFEFQMLAEHGGIDDGSFQPISSVSVRGEVLEAEAPQKVYSSRAPVLASQIVARVKVPY
jgi:hypothetical protein